MGRILPYIMENKKCLKPPTNYVQLQQNMTAEPSEGLAEDFRLILPELIDLATQLIQIDASLRSFLKLRDSTMKNAGKMVGKWEKYPLVN